MHANAYDFDKNRNHFMQLLESPKCSVLENDPSPGRLSSLKDAFGSLILKRRTIGYARPECFLKVCSKYMPRHIDDRIRPFELTSHK